MSALFVQQPPHGLCRALGDVLHQVLDPLAPIDVIEDVPFNVGSAIKYLWRAGLKPREDADKDLAKSAWYIRRERDRLQRKANRTAPPGLERHGPQWYCR